MEGVGQQVMEWAANSGLKVVGAILILILGRIIAGAVRGMLRKVMRNRNQDPGLTGFVGNLAYGLIIGFALQGSLSNFAAGVMLLAFRPFRVGDYIEAAGTAGSVIDIQLFNTVLHTPDNVKVIVPNGKIFGDVIKNYSANDTRRVDLVIRPWVRKEDYWSVRFDLTRRIKESFDKNGIEIPFPQRVIHQPSAPSKN